MVLIEKSFKHDDTWQSSCFLNHILLTIKTNHHLSPYFMLFIGSCPKIVVSYQELIEIIETIYHKYLISNYTYLVGYLIRNRNLS
jgi:hypothetical protein